jgi:hypothetical protein
VLVSDNASVFDRCSEDVTLRVSVLLTDSVRVKFDVNENVCEEDSEILLLPERE